MPRPTGTPIELLAPAKTAEIGRAAILHGADAVYIGGPAFGARHAAGNSIGEIAELVEFAHRYRARIYVALNTILRDDELASARAIAWQCHEAGVDALIIQDMGLLMLDLPPMALHASTQCDIRTPEKARFLADVGFSQLILARELSIDEVRTIRAAVPDDVVIEYFIHGALCVAFSGQCYISHAQTGRSANRGDCSQACRLPYTLEDERGKIIAYEKHLLSLKDNNQSDNLKALIDAGIGSFKIEGRYKDTAYVKNITGHYRYLLDRLIESNPGLLAASAGKTKLFFTPDPEKTFHRGMTDYFAGGRKNDIGAFSTPGFIGIPIGTVVRTDRHCFDLSTDTDLVNGDGLAYIDKRQPHGLRADRVELLGDTSQGTIWRVWPNDMAALLTSLRPHTVIHRNRDQHWESTLEKTSAERRLDLFGRFAETAEGYTLSLTDSEGIGITCFISAAHEPAHQAQSAGDKLREQLNRFGNSIYRLSQLEIDWPTPRFIPASLVNQLRRQAVTMLEQERAIAYRKPIRRNPAIPLAQYPETRLTYLANIYNQSARTFYHRHGVLEIAPAYEAHQEQGDVSLMITKQCLRFAFSLCPKQAKGVIGVQGRITAEPLTLVSGNERLRLEFDCRACQMHVIGRIKRHVLNIEPTPITLHRTIPRT